MNAMQELLGHQVKIVAGKHAGKQGKLVSITHVNGASEAEVLLKRRSFFRFFHLLSSVFVSPTQLAAA